MQATRLKIRIKIAIEKFFFYASISLALGYIDTLIPKPVPMLRYGLANLPLILTVMEGKFTNSVIALAAKISASSLVGLNFLSPALPASMLGSLGSWFSMWAFSKTIGKNSSPVSTSAIGALANTWIQSASLYLILGKDMGKVIIALLPVAMLQGLAGAIFNGVVAGSTVKYITRFEKI